MAFLEKMGVETVDFVFAAPKRHFLARNHVVWRILCQNRCTGLGCSLSQEPKQEQLSQFVPRGTKASMRRTETPEAIWLKFGMLVDITDVVTYTNFGDHRLRGFWVAAGQIFPTPIDFHRRPYNTLALPCKCVISSNNNYCTHCQQKVYICSATCIACSRVDGRSGKCVYRIGA